MSGNYKSRSISSLDYYAALQREYVCSSIRWAIYTQSSDIKHMENVLLKKKNKILSMYDRNKKDNIFNNKNLLISFFKEIVPKYGLPRFIYNERTQPDHMKKQYSFPYSGTLVEVKKKGKKVIGHTDYVDFDNKAIYVQFDKRKESEKINYKLVRRLTVEETDRYYYYSRNVQFDHRYKKGIFFSSDYDFFNDILTLKSKEEEFTTNGDNVSRHLNYIVKWIYQHGSKKNN